DSARKAIHAISLQGEGSRVPQDLESCHFGKFLEIYRAFPERGEWTPARNVAANPTTNPLIVDPTRRLSGAALDWATLSNLRYRMLLVYLKHAFYVEAPLEYPSRSPRGALVSWAFGEMYNLRALAEILMDLPMAPDSNTAAGPPFEMPYSLTLPIREQDRWR